MTPPHTELDMAAIEDRCSKATPLPWDMEESDGCWHLMDELGDKVIADLIDLRDAHYILAACNSFPALVQEVKRLTENGPLVTDYLRDECDRLRAVVDAQGQELAVLRADNARLREDKERLDYLERNHFIRGIANKSQDALVYSTTIALPGENLRQAIDKARAALANDSEKLKGS